MAIVTSKSDSVRTDSDWHRAFKTAVRDGPELCRRLGLSREFEEPARRASAKFPVFAPLGYIDRMMPGDPTDPLLRQVLPLEAELDDVPGFSSDPVGDGPASLSPGVLKKYAGRVLMVTTGACAIHCRYCFRREYPYLESPHDTAPWQPALDRIASDATVHEVLLSGGDPLTLPDSQIADLVSRLAQIDHVRRVRVHTRLPIIIPERVTSGLIAALRQTRLIPWVVLHTNHPNELDGRVSRSVSQLVDHGIPLLNQSVLLRSINDDLDVLEQLCLDLVDLRVVPYYLHQLDRVAGAAHFEVPIGRGHELIAGLRSRLPGYAVPRYVQEVPGESSKRDLFENG